MPEDPFAAPGAAPSGAGDLPAYGQPPYGAPPWSASPSTLPAAGWQGPELASWGRRVGGALIDGLISLAVQVVLGLASRSLAQVVGLAVLLFFGYLTGTTGQTPGRRAMGITVLREADGQVLGAGAGIGRAFLHIFDALSLGLGYLWPLWDPKKQTFADKIIHSVVVKK